MTITQKIASILAASVGLVVVATVWASQPAPVEKLPAKAQAEKQEKTQAKATKPSANPFRYSKPDQNGGFVPATTRIPAGIKVLGIMIVDGQKPLAVLQVPGMTDVLYVRPGDIVGVTSKPVALKRKATRKASGSAGVYHDVVYLKIEKITDQQVELYPQKNPAGLQILR